MRFTTLSILILASIFILSGCFTALSKHAGAWNGNSSTPPQAILLDAATAPIQAPFLIIGGIKYAASNDNLVHQKDFQANFISDQQFRQQFIRSKSFKLHHIDLLMYENMANAINEEDVRFLWDRFRNQVVTVSTRGAWLITPRSTPSDILDAWYRIYISGVEKREEKPYPITLIFYKKFLLHPNLSNSLISEIRSYEIEEVNVILDKRKTN